MTWRSGREIRCIESQGGNLPSRAWSCVRSRSQNAVPQCYHVPGHDHLAYRVRYFPVPEGETFNPVGEITCRRVAVASIEPRHIDSAAAQVFKMRGKFISNSSDKQLSASLSGMLPGKNGATTGLEIPSMVGESPVFSAI